MKLLKKSKKAFCNRSDLDLIMFGDCIGKVKIKIPLKWVFIGLVRYIVTIRKYEKKKLKGVFQYFEEKSRYMNIYSDLSNEESIYIMRRYMLLFRIFGKFFRESWNCLAQACSLYVGLSTLGFEVELVIGKFVYYASEQFDFHAWVESCGIPINDKESVHERCIVIYRKANK